MKTPKYRRHSSGRAYIEVAGLRHFLPGKFDSETSRREYHRIISNLTGMGLFAWPKDHSKATIRELCRCFMDYCHAKGLATATIYAYDDALSGFIKRCGDKPAATIDAKMIRENRGRAILQGSSAATVQRNERVIRRAIRWGVSHEFVPLAVLQSVLTVDPVCGLSVLDPDRLPVESVPLHTVYETTNKMPNYLARMVQLQFFAGCRTSSLVRMRSKQITRFTRGPWKWKPWHKMRRNGELVIWLGPIAKSILHEVWQDDPSAYFFRATVKNKPHIHMTEKSYANSIRYYQQKHNLTPWTPHQLRHSFAERVREKFGIEAAQAALGVKNLKTAEIYSGKQEQTAIRVADAIG